MGLSITSVNSISVKRNIKVKNRKCNKVAVITGGSRGIGLGIARNLVAEGFDLFIIGKREESQVKSLNELRGNNRRVLYCQGDISSTDNIESIVKKIYAYFPVVNLLVNNAGIAPKTRIDLLQVTKESYFEVMNTNLTGAFFLTQCIANRMIEAKIEDSELRALIVIISSISARVASVDRAEYCISKAGLSMVAKLFACRLGEFNIPVYEIRPGIIKTDMTEKVSKKYDRLLAEGLCVTARWGLPEDIGKVVVSLSQGSFIYSTGQVITVDGGLTLPRL